MYIIQSKLNPMLASCWAMMLYFIKQSVSFVSLSLFRIRKVHGDFSVFEANFSLNLSFSDRKCGSHFSHVAADSASNKTSRILSGIGTKFNQSCCFSASEEIRRYVFFLHSMTFSQFLTRHRHLIKILHRCFLECYCRKFFKLK